MAQARKKLTESQSNAGIELAKLKKIQQDQNKLTKLEIQLNKSKEGSYDKLSAQYSLNKIRLNQMSKSQRETTDSGKKLEKETKAIYEEMNRLQKATGKSQLQVGQYERGLNRMTDSFGMMPGPMGRVVTGFKTMATAAKAFIATPVGIILAAFVAAGATIKKVISISKEFETQMDKVQSCNGSHCRRDVSPQC